MGEACCFMITAFPLLLGRVAVRLLKQQPPVLLLCVQGGYSVSLLPDSSIFTASAERR